MATWIRVLGEYFGLLPEQSSVTACRVQGLWMRDWPESGQQWKSSPSWGAPSPTMNILRPIRYAPPTAHTLRRIPTPVWVGPGRVPLHCHGFGVFLSFGISFLNLLLQFPFFKLRYNWHLSLYAFWCLPWFDICIYCKMITAISLVNICHFTLLQKKNFFTVMFTALD